jgi:hypothetical protein
MSKAVKAALMSALLFPGLGQMYLKRYVRGLIPMVLILIGLGVRITEATLRALQELDRIQIQGGFIDPNAVAARAAASSAAGDWYSPFIMPAVALCWLLSVIDAYRLGKEKEPPGAHDRPGGR